LDVVDPTVTREDLAEPERLRADQMVIRVAHEIHMERLAKQRAELHARLADLIQLVRDAKRLPQRRARRVGA
jgi:hypothetical protein